MLQKIKLKLFNFMQGRYGGSDGLNLFLIIVYFILMIIRAFIRNSVFGSIVYLLALGVLTYSVFRMLSRNVYSRQTENAKFMKIWYKIKPKFILFKDRIKDIRTKRYRTCPHCKNVLRLPYKRGKHGVRCPKCGQEFSVRIL